MGVVNMKIAAVTTFNSDGFNKYGKRMIETFAEKWYADVPLIVYQEGWTWNQIGGEEYRDLLSCSTWLADFKKRNAYRNKTNFRFDAIRFSHKIAALLHALEDETLDYVIWLDGDIVTHSIFTDEDLAALLPRDTWIAWLDRCGTYPECGFYIINCRHNEHPLAVEELRCMYENDELFAEREWHDSYILQQVVKHQCAETTSLSGRFGRTTHHPLVNSGLAAWFDHLKGARKSQGRSHKSDLRRRRPEAHWQ